MSRKSSNVRKKGVTSSWYGFRSWLTNQTDFQSRREERRGGGGQERPNLKGHYTKTNSSMVSYRADKFLTLSNFKNLDSMMRRQPTPHKMSLSSLHRMILHGRWYRCSGRTDSDIVVPTLLGGVCVLKDQERLWLFFGKCTRHSL